MTLTTTCTAQNTHLLFFRVKSSAEDKWKAPTVASSLVVVTISTCTCERERSGATYSNSDTKSRDPIANNNI